MKETSYLLTTLYITARPSGGRSIVKLRRAAQCSAGGHASTATEGGRSESAKSGEGANRRQRPRGRREGELWVEVGYARGWAGDLTGPLREKGGRADRNSIALLLFLADATDLAERKQIGVGG